ncbi:APC family permease [Pseudomonas asiatica]|uniref:APC family permease n=1 Tax=Pseudomonas asiatica TaxID=2219225 RepID=UPI00383B661E
MSTTTESQALRGGVLNVRHLVFFVVAAAAPLTTIGGFAPLAFSMGGQSSPVGYLIAGLVYGLFAVGFCAMSRYVKSGAFSAYIGHGLGHRMGGGAAVVAWLGYTTGQIGFCAAAGLFASHALGSLAGVEVNWPICAAVIALGTAYVSYCRVDLGAKLLALLLFGEIGILILLAVAIILKGGPEGFSLEGFNPGNWSMSAMGSLFIITFVVYIGFEQTAVYAEESKDPIRTVPRATYVAVILLAALYTVLSWVLLMAIGPSSLSSFLTTGDPSMMVINLNEKYLGSFMSNVMQVLIVTSFIAGVLALQNAGARYLFNMGRDGIVSNVFARTSQGNGTPKVAVFTQGTLVFLATVAFGMSSLDPYSQLVVWMNTPTLVGVLGLQVLTSIAVIRFFAKCPGEVSRWHSVIAPGLAVLSLGAVLILICCKMDLLTGLDTTGNLLVNIPLLLAFAFGFYRAHLLGASSTAGLDPSLPSVSKV